MRPVPTSADTAAARGIARADPDNLPSAAPVAPISCFITTEADLDSAAAACPEPEYRAKSHAHGSVPGTSPSLSDDPAYRQRTASQTSFDMEYGIGATAIPTGHVGARSVASGLSSLGISSSSSSACDPDDLSANSAALVFPGDPGASLAGSSVPQLVMPSLTVPRRRPFSDVGKSLGNLKLLVSGQAGIGKTSLIRSLGQKCQHVVYMDSPASCSVQTLTEVLGSTRPHPWWRAESEDANCANKRRKFTADDILDKNICFVDCPPFANDTEVTEYVQSQLMRLCNKPMEDVDLCHLLSSGAESIVHAVLYMLPNAGPSEADVRRIRALQEMTNVIPLLAKADELADKELALSKRRLLETLSSEHLDVFSFSGPGPAQKESGIYAVSCAAQSDGAASEYGTNMSFENIHPHELTDLDDLTDHIFSLDGSSWLRYSAAVKSVNWRRRQFLENTCHSALTYRSLGRDGTVACRCSLAATSLVNGVQYGWRMDPSSWAESLRRSLAAERLGRSQAARAPGMDGFEVTLRKAIGSTIPVHDENDAAPSSNVSQDPLGLLKLMGQINHGARLSLELLSSLGFISCIAVWLIRPELAHHWDRSLPTCWCMTTW